MKTYRNGKWTGTESHFDYYMDMITTLRDDAESVLTLLRRLVDCDKLTVIEYEGLWNYAAKVVFGV